MEGRIERLRDWLEAVVVDQEAESGRSRVRVIEFSVPGESQNAKAITRDLRTSACTQWQALDGDVGKSKGIYIWFWPGVSGSPPWPLYVGKSQRGRSCFRSRTTTHLAHAERGIDSLYDWDKSIHQGVLVPSHSAPSPICSETHAKKLRGYLDGMRVLTLSMDTREAEELGSDAEALMLAAALKLHEAVDPSGAPRSAWDKVTNSRGRTSSMSSLSAVWDEAATTLSHLMYVPLPSEAYMTR